MKRGRRRAGVVEEVRGRQGGRTSVLNDKSVEFGEREIFFKGKARRGSESRFVTEEQRRDWEKDPRDPLSAERSEHIHKNLSVPQV